MRLSVVDPQRCVGCQCCMFACARLAGNGGFAGSSIGVRSAGGMRNGFKIVVCSACSSPACEAVCPTGALRPRNKGGGVLFDSSKCIGCGHCKDACKIGAVFWDDENNKPVICKYCGYCAKYCPYGVIEFDKGDKLKCPNPDTEQSLSEVKGRS